MERRRVLFPFTRAVEDKDKDEHLVEKIQNELGGIIRKLYDEFKDPNDAKKALERQRKSKEALEMKIKNDHILEFIEEFTLIEQVTNQCLIFGSSRGMPANDSPLVYERLYWIYLLFCDIHGRPEKSRLKPNDLKQELDIAFKTAGYKTRFQNRQLQG